MREMFCLQWTRNQDLDAAVPPFWMSHVRARCRFTSRKKKKEENGKIELD
jgi:hypothetical protein